MKEIKKISALFFISLLFLLISCEEGSNEIDGKKPADVKSIVITTPYLNQQKSER